MRTPEEQLRLDVSGLPIAGSTAVVTGAASGIGAAVAHRLLDEGAVLTVVDINGYGLAGLSDRGARTIVADLSDPDARSRVIEQCLGAAFLVNAAGMLFVAPLLEVSLEQWRRIWMVNVDSMFFMCQGIGPTMPAGGAIVNLSSTSAKLSATVDVAPYSMTKLAALGITRSFACEFAARPVRVNAVCPGVIDTPMQEDVLAGLARVRGVSIDEIASKRLDAVPLGRAASPAECAGLIRFLLSPEASYMTGQAINYSGGLVTW